jgi:hypothetical protein
LALRVFTAEFGMGSGVLPLAMATRPSKRLDPFGPCGPSDPSFESCEADVSWVMSTRCGSCRCAWRVLRPAGLRRRLVCWLAPGWRGIEPIERLVPVSFTHCCASTPGLSTWWSSTALIARPGFEGSFPLRCFQRLSRPHIATRRCAWRHNRYTRGASIPVLSY